MLPPYITTENPGKGFAHKVQPLYGSAQDIEVLSYINDTATQGFIGAFLLRRKELGELFPESLQFRQSVPTTIILVNPEMEKSMKQEMVKDLAINGSREGSNMGMIPQMTLPDSESVNMLYVLSAVSEISPTRVKMGSSSEIPFANRRIGVTGYEDISLTKGYVDMLILRRSPSLPFWYRSVVSRFFRLPTEGGIKWTDEDVIIPRISWQLMLDQNSADQVRKEKEVDDSIVGSTVLARKKDKTPLRYVPKPIIPMSSFLAGPFGGAEQGDRYQLELWFSQDILFVRWALADETHARRKAMWEFVDRSSHEHTTETLFQQCFGMDYKEAEKELSEYLPMAMKDPLLLVSASSINVSEIKLNVATRSQISRVNGNWEREEIKYVRQAYPDLVPSYIDRAEADFVTAQQNGVADLQFLVTLALYDVEIGKNDEAKPLLQMAVDAHVARPSVYIELARILYGQALSQPAGKSGKFSIEQVGAILRLLKESSEFLPAQIETYAIATDTWSRSEVYPSSDDIAFLKQGGRFFPENSKLISSIEKLQTSGKSLTSDP